MKAGDENGKKSKNGMKKKDDRNRAGDGEDSESLFYAAIYRVTANKA